MGACLASIGFSVIAYDLAVVTRDHGLSGLWVAHLPASQICAQIWFLGFYKAWYDFAYYTLNTIQLSYTILFVAISFGIVKYIRLSTQTYKICIIKLKNELNY